MDQEHLAAIRARLEAATPGPWPTSFGPCGSDDGPWHHTAWGPMHEENEDGNHEQASERAAADAEFIAHAPQDIADLLAEVDSLLLQLGLALCDASHFEGLSKRLIGQVVELKQSSSRGGRVFDETT